MPAYVIVHVEVSDMERFKQYGAAAPAAAERFGGRYLARGGEKVTLEGPEVTQRVVLLEFPTLQAAQDWYASPEYQTAKALREGAAVSHILAVDGLAG
jgi:uncharacterized protein (DUF1330 family)